MLAAIREPLSPRQLMLATGGAAVAVALYCVGYSALAGQSESFGESLAWAVVNVVPWIPALEGAKRARGIPGVAIAIACGFTSSMLLGLLIDGVGTLSFEVWRRLPALIAVAVIAMIFHWNWVFNRRGAAESLPLLPRQIDWVQAAGNYVELRAGGRTIVHRSSIAAAERHLAGHGFVRIHRSTLVRRDRIARVRPVDVVLTDGTHLKIGKRFRSQLSN